ncbi:hypothetical protein D9M73_177140 [compost metagenome]
MVLAVDARAVGRVVEGEAAVEYHQVGFLQASCQLLRADKAGEGHGTGSCVVAMLSGIIKLLRQMRWHSAAFHRLGVSQHAQPPAGDPGSNSSPWNESRRTQPPIARNARERAALLYNAAHLPRAAGKPRQPSRRFS